MKKKGRKPAAPALTEAMVNGIIAEALDDRFLLKVSSSRPRRARRSVGQS
jgi:hypothetical protein